MRRCPHRKVYACISGDSMDALRVYRRGDLDDVLGRRGVGAERPSGKILVERVEDLVLEVHGAVGEESLAGQRGQQQDEQHARHGGGYYCRRRGFRPRLGELGENIFLMRSTP